MAIIQPDEQMEQAFNDVSYDLFCKAISNLETSYIEFGETLDKYYYDLDNSNHAERSKILDKIEKLYIKFKIIFEDIKKKINSFTIDERIKESNLQEYQNLVDEKNMILKKFKFELIELETEIKKFDKDLDKKLAEELETRQYPHKRRSNEPSRDDDDNSNHRGSGDDGSNGLLGLGIGIF